MNWRAAAGPRARGPKPVAGGLSKSGIGRLKPGTCGQTGTGSRFGNRRGQALTEFAMLYAGVILPLTFMTVFVAQALWIWHGMTEWTRDGARYAATSCYDLDAQNRVIAYMQSHVPPIVDQAQFQAGGSATIQVVYGTPACDDCIPDTVTVSVGDYTFGRLAGYLRLPGISMPSFTTNLPMESAGFRDGTGTCAQP